MNKLIEGLNASAKTENGCDSFHSTNSKCLDLFYLIGSSRGRDITGPFLQAFAENEDLALRILLWARDIRQGAGERQQFRNLMKTLIETLDEDRVTAIINKVPELGRFDDLKVFFGTRFESVAAELWVRSIRDGNGLAAKWAPRKDKKGAKPLRSAIGLTEARWRKLVVPLSNTVEQQMCAKQWDEIEFGKVPSVASGRYMTAFHRNAGAKYQAYKDALEKGEAKVNAGAVYPYDVIRSMNNGDVTVANAQWEALPDYIESDESFLPIIDTSYSMNTKVSGSVSAVDVAVSLGLYTSQRNKGVFRDVFMTFSERPSLQRVTGTLQQRYRGMSTADWGMNTNIEAVFDLLLDTALAHNVPESDMPTKLLVVSDMQFDCMRGGGTAFDNARRKYAAAGYKMPQIVFWQVNARAGGIPVTMGTGGTALVSGFSPSIMRSVLNGDLDPVKVMLDTVMVDRYTL